MADPAPLCGKPAIDLTLWECFCCYKNGDDLGMNHYHWLYIEEIEELQEIRWT